MIATQDLTFGEIKVTVKQLTVGEFRNWWQLVSKRNNSEMPEIDLAFNFFYGLFPQDVQAFCTDFVDFDVLLQSDIVKIIDTIKELNPNFLKISQSQEATTQRLMALINQSQPSLLADTATH